MGLRERERDPGLPGLAGEESLLPPSAEELVELVDAHLRKPDAPPITGARWDYARWKTGVSITSVYSLLYADGVEQPVVVKRYVDGKDRSLSYRPRNEENLERLCERTLPRVLLAERSLSLWVPVADRVLRGLPVLLDRRKLGHFVTRTGIAPAGSVKKRKIEYTLLRYKPERRAVHRLNLRLRLEERPRMALAARTLPPGEAARVIATRSALKQAGGVGIATTIAASNAHQGYLLEPWLEHTAFAPDSFEHAREAGAALARLHAIAPPEGTRAVSGGLPGDLEQLFRVDARLAALPRADAHPAPERLVFCHGDFHPDQVVRLADGSWSLMDLDLLGAGDPAFDLGCWMADWIIENQRADLEAAGETLLDGYRSEGGTSPARERLARFTAAELVCRAGSSLRRLEKGAVAKASFALEAAEELLRS